MGQGQKGKRPPTYGPQVKARVERLLEALLSYFNQEVEGCEHLEIESNWQTDNQVVVRTKSGTLEKLTGQDSYPGKLTKGQIGEALHKYLGSFLGILEDQRTQTKGSEDLHFTLKLWHGRDKNKNLAQFDKEWKSRRSQKSKAQEIALTSISKKPIALNKPLEPQLDQTLRLYLAKSFNDDGFAELDQAGETDPERRTLLKQVFIDLDLTPFKEQRPQDLELENLLSASAIGGLLNEYCLKIVIIGGPGQGKSTLGQQLAQIHRTKLLDKPYDFEYLLHHRASQENVQSLLPEEEFKLAIRKFLRKGDSRSSEDAIDSKIKQLVGEAQERLVLIVAPEPGLFGFELRSFQEFFAAVHLAQTASDTQQRFERLKAIACSEHWRNVALFFAGRIVRNFKGEASNILELVCRTVDRGEPKRYLRPGCWLALEIAIDGALSTNRDLQYNAVEYGLEVLETGLTEEQQEYLSSLTQ